MSRVRVSKFNKKKAGWKQIASNFKWHYLAYFLAVVILAQIFYPQNLARPNTDSYGWQSTSEIAKKLKDRFKSTTVEVQASDSRVTLKASEIGASIDADNLAEQLTRYDFWQRLIPFSVFFGGESIRSIALEFNDANLDESVAGIAMKLNSESKDGSININDKNEIIIEPAKNGVAVKDLDIKNTLKNAKYIIGNTNKISVEAKVTKPAIDNEKIQNLKTDIASMSKVEITLTNSLTKKVSTPTSQDILSWLNIENNTEISFDEEAISSYLNRIAKDSIIEAGTTKIVIVDDKETSKSVGANGRAVDASPVIKTIEDALNNKSDKAATINFTETKPKIVYDRSYNHSQKALQSYIDKVTGSGTISISVKQLNGDGWSASSKATNSVVSASTYKLYISQILMKKIDAGTIKWTDPIQGTTVSKCLENTIVVSANNCAVDWLRQWGARNVNNTIYGLGFSKATTFTASDAVHTSAADLQKMLIGLHNRSLFSSANADRLIGLMKRQVYRKGIPAGSAGTVADKVGFLWGYLNDAAIVYHPKGTYVLVIMTNNQSWAKIAEITRQIEKIMYSTD